jgi:serine/threonine protein kinase/WD40 repeat protein
LNDVRPDVKSLFFEAIDQRSPEELRCFLDRACADDTKLRANLEQLLRAHRDAGNFLGGSSPAAIDQPRLERPGAQIGPYKLLEQIGEGGMGVVFMSEQTRPVQRRVALKIIKAGMDTRQVVARFEAERQALAMMDHPNIARVLDAGATETGRPYFVMELVRGVSMTEFCNQNSISIRDRLELFVTVCHAVQHAHQKGIIHRDIKPTNVLVTLHDRRPVIKVIDFGVAKATGQKLTDKTLFTGFTQMIGTPLYMSPEQAEMSGLDVDTRSDIYSLGVLLYELLTGTTPFTKARFKTAAYDEIRRIIREEEPPKPSTRMSTVDRASTTISEKRQSDPRTLSRLFRGELDWIVMKALEKDRTQRYETASGLAGDIQRYLSDQPVLACPPSAAYRLRKFARRNKAALAMAGLISAALILGTVASSYFALKANTRAHEADDARIRATAAEKAAREDENGALQAEHRARLREADALVGQAHGTRYSRRPGQRFEALTALGKAADIGRELGQPPEWFDRLRNEAIAALALPDIHITQEFGTFPQGTVSVELNDDFTVYARTTEKGGCTIRRVVDDREVCRLPEFGEPPWASFGSGGMLAVGGRSGRFQLWDVSGSQPALRFAERNVNYYGWHFRDGGGLLGLVHGDGGISIYDTATCTRLHQLAPTEIDPDLRVNLHPTGPFVAAYSYFHNVVQVRDLRSGAVVASALPPWSGGNGHCAWSPDGRTLLVSQGDGGKIQEYAFDSVAPALRPTRTLQSPMEQGSPYIFFHPTGDRFVSRGWSNHVVLFDVLSGQPLFSTHALPSATGLRFDRTGERLAAARVGTRNDRIGLWSFAGGLEYRYLVHAGDQKSTAYYANGPTVHPGGRLAAIGLTDGVAIFDLETGSELAHILSGNVCAQFDGAGNLLTNGFEGCFRWPVRPDQANPTRLVVGPPAPLPFHPGDREIAASRDGRVIAQSMWAGYGMEPFAGGWILHPDAPAPRLVNAGKTTGWCSVSPDGRWVAFGDHVHYAEVFETATGKSLRKWPAGPPNLCRFSPDGRWLITGVDNDRVYATGTWEPGPQLGAGEPTDATSELVVLAQTNGIYRLVELATGRELAQLEDPEQNTRPAVFTPDGTKLIVAAMNGLRVWDLRRIRTELTKLRLDWDAPPLPAASWGADATPLAAAPLSIHLDLGAGNYVRLNQWDKADGEYAQTDWSRPLCDDALAYACLFLIRGDSEGYSRFCQDMIQRAAETKDPFEAYVLARSCAMARKSPIEPARAVQWANQALASDHHPWCFHALGLAQYRAGQFDQALQSFTKANVKTWPDSELNWFGLALVHHRLGHTDEARQCLDKGIQWLEREGPPSPELPAKLLPQDWLEAQLLRREAEEMLKMERSP